VATVSIAQHRGYSAVPKPLLGTKVDALTQHRVGTSRGFVVVRLHHARDRDLRRVRPTCKHAGILGIEAVSTEP
jgi:hypothetical protein